LNEYGEKKLGIDCICNVYNDIDNARSKLLNDKQDINKEEARVAAKNAFESEFLKAKQLLKKRKIDLISDDANIGGRDFDEKLFQSFVHQRYARYSKELKTILLDRCCDAKINLSLQNKTEIDLGNLTKKFDNVSLTRKQFEETCSQLILNIKKILSETINHAKSLNKEVVIIVSGLAAKLPQIRSEMNGFNTVYYTDDALSKGAAIHCAHMTNDERRNITLKNKTYFRYKFECDYIAP
ncbi:heat shock protein 70-like protein, partial [Leptotrombidium deliense]